MGEYPALSDQDIAVIRAQIRPVVESSPTCAVLVDVATVVAR